MKIKLTLLLLTLWCSTTYSQGLFVTVKSDTVPLPFAVITLIDLENQDTLIEETDFNGKAQFDSLKESTYSLTAHYQDHQFKKFNSIDIVDSNSYFLKLNSKPCKPDYKIKKCPKGKSKKKVIRVYNGMITHLSFANRRDALKYQKRLTKQGFETTELDEGEFLIAVYDEKLDSIFSNTNLCDRYLFCKKHKILFK